MTREQPIIEQAVARAEGSLWPRGAVVLVACSGGADSVALAAAAARCGVQCAIGHVDHGLRPESADEAAGVRALAGRLGAPFFVERLGPELAQRVRAQGLEAAAREARYRALASLARAAGAAAVATGHTRRDQAETLLLRLLRGAGPGALAGVRRSRPLEEGLILARPLLALGREDTEAYCADRGLPFTRDPHNQDPARARARLRALWPTLRQLNPRLDEALSRAASALADEDDLLQAQAAGALADAREGGGYRAASLLALHPALQRRALLLAAAGEGLRPERRHLEALATLLAGEGELHLPGGRVTVHGGVLALSPPGEGPPPCPLAVPGPGRYTWGVRALSVAEGGGEGVPVDLSLAPFPWTLRAAAPGDRLRPARGRTRKVSDWVGEARIPRERRAGLATLVDAHGRTFWVEGLRATTACESRGAPRASFLLRPEMDAPDGTLSHPRQGDLRSATMRPGSDEERR